MEFPSLISSASPVNKNVCRTCLGENGTMISVLDSIDYEMNKIKLIDILVILRCVESNDEENWPQVMCDTCVSTALLSYSFKLTCQKSNVTLSQLFTTQASNNLHQNDIDSIDINVVYQDHEYLMPFFNNPLRLDYESTLDENKELTPLPPVTEITLTEQPPRKELEKKYPCHICAKSFTRIHTMRYHMVKHSGFRRHLCFKCGNSFYTASGLKQHLQTHKIVGIYKCGFCKKIYKSKQSLKTHFRVAHSNKRHSFNCTICDKSFTAKSTLRMHTKTHSGVKEFACTECPKTYTRASYLRLHQLVHSGQDRPKPFKCQREQCGRNFPSKHSLTVHIAHSHSSVKPYKCDICNKAFATSGGLHNHTDTHITQDVTCDVCGKQVPNKRSLVKHLKEHNVNTVNLSEMNMTVVDSTFFDHFYI